MYIFESVKLTEKKGKEGRGTTLCQATEDKSGYMSGYFENVEIDRSVQVKYDRRKKEMSQWTDQKINCRKKPV